MEGISHYLFNQHIMPGCVNCGLLKERLCQMLPRATFTGKWQCPVKTLLSGRLVM